MDKTLDRLEWIFGKPAGSEFRTAGILLFMTALMVAFSEIGLSVLYLTTRYIFAHWHVKYVPHWVVRGTLIFPLAFGTTGGLLGWVIGYRINRKASPRAKLVMVRCLDVGTVIVSAPCVAYFAYEAARDQPLRQLYLGFAGVALLVAMTPFRILRRMGFVFPWIRE